MVMLVGNYDTGRCIFPLRSLQIRDLQSYRSHLSLFLATKSNKFYILVDNRPWLKGLGSRPAHLWQLMVTKTDTLLAIETKFMRRWEFDSIMQAVGCMRSWLSWTYHEQNLLREYLRSIVVLSIMLPVFLICREIMYAPMRLALALATFVVFACSLVYEMLGELWSTPYSVFYIASATEAIVTTATTYEVSMWHSLWNDLFSKVFRAVGSILNGFVDFFATCNRHRLSIYNRIKELIRKLSRKPCLSWQIYPHHRKRLVDLYQQAQIRRNPKTVETANREAHVKME